MAEKDKDGDQLMDDLDGEGEEELEFEQSDDLDFPGENGLLLDDDEEEGDEEIIPTVLYKGVSRPKSEEEWRQLLLEAETTGQSVPEYRIGDGYREGDLVQHASFGLGVVSKILTPTKMEVVYRNDRKLMAMNVVPPRSA